jgi:hypothetical protein
MELRSVLVQPTGRTIGIHGRAGPHRRGVRTGILHVELSTIGEHRRVPFDGRRRSLGDH